jgi:hypothetical protein
VCVCGGGGGARVLERIPGLAMARCKPKSDGGLGGRGLLAGKFSILLGK